MDLVQWLGVQLDTDTVRATAAAAGASGEWFMGAKWNVYRAEDETPDEEGETNALVVYGNVKDQSEHIAEHDPAQTLREIEAKRRIVRAYEDAVTSFGHTELGTEAHDLMTGSVTSLRYTLQLLAVSYEGRPGFKEEWRP